MNIELTKNLITEEFLLSNNLDSDLEATFNSNYDEEPICKEVCERVKQLSDNPKVLIRTNFSIWLMNQRPEPMPISNSGHFVIMYKNKIYDYTSNQYCCYGIEHCEGVRVLSPVKGTGIFKDVSCYDDQSGMYRIVLNNT